MNLKKCFISVLVAALSVSNQMSSRAMISMSSSVAEKNVAEEVDDDFSENSEKVSEDDLDLEDEEEKNYSMSLAEPVANAIQIESPNFLSDFAPVSMKVSEPTIATSALQNHWINKSELLSASKLAPISLMKVSEPTNLQTSENLINLDNNTELKFEKILAPTIATSALQNHWINKSELPSTSKLAPISLMKVSEPTNLHTSENLTKLDNNPELKFEKTLAPTIDKSALQNYRVNMSEIPSENGLYIKNMSDLLKKIKSVATDSQLSKIRVSDKNANVIDLSLLSEDEFFDLLQRIIPTVESKEKPLHYAMVVPPKGGNPPHEESCKKDNDTVNFYKTGDILTMQFLSVLGSMTILSFLGLCIMARKHFAKLSKKIRLLGLRK